MALNYFLADPAWDKPFFKVLANNDTGAAPGHQGGIVVPRDLRSYLPGLVGATTPTNPTISTRITAELYDGLSPVAVVSTRYQYQTWGGARPAESRLTDSLGPIRNLASGEDVLIFQRALLDLYRYRLVLVRRSSALHAEVTAFIGTRRWGSLGADGPVTTIDLDVASREEAASEASPFNMFDPAAATVTVTSVRVARSIAFQQTVISIYGRLCCVCGCGLANPNGQQTEVEAAHIVPRKLRGADDARNGLALCRSHHWAFDRGLFGMNNDHRIVVPPVVAGLPQNASLAALTGRLLRAPSRVPLAPETAALAWHRGNVLLA